MRATAALDRELANSRYQLKSQMVRETLDWLDQYLGPVK